MFYISKDMDQMEMGDYYPTTDGCPTCHTPMQEPLPSISYPKMPMPQMTYPQSPLQPKVAYPETPWMTPVKPIDTAKNYGMDQPIYDLFGPSITEGKKPVTKPASSFISLVQNCALTCYRTLAMVAGKNREKQVKLLNACAMICNSQAILTAMESVFAHEHALFCAKVSEVCAHECGQHADKASQHCAQICLETSKACEQYAKSL